MHKRAFSPALPSLLGLGLLAFSPLPAENLPPRTIQILPELSTLSGPNGGGYFNPGIIFINDDSFTYRDLSTAFPSSVTVSATGLGGTQPRNLGSATALGGKAFAAASTPGPAMAAATVPTSAPAGAQVLNGPGSAEIRASMEAVFPALVRIHVLSEEGSDGRMRKQRSSGSGAIITPEGHILTNHHVAGRGTRFVVTLATREEVDATLVGTDPLADLAIIKLDLSTRRLEGPLPVAKFGDSDSLKVGDIVLAMGSPAGLSQSVTRGIVSNLEMIAPRSMGGGLTLDGENVGELVRWIGHDAVIFGGNSGGPLVNLRGEIIGVNEVGIGSLGGAIPAKLAREVARQLMEKGRVVRSWIGLEVQPLLRAMAREKGVLVSSVFPGSPAEQAGIRSGDFILRYNGEATPDAHADEDIPVFNAMVLNTSVGAKVRVDGLRDGKPLSWELATVEREAVESREGELDSWGITARDFTRVAALERKLKERVGVLVDSIRGNGPSDESKPALRPEDIILKVGDKAVNSLAELTAVTAALTKDLTAPRPVLVTFKRGTQEMVTVVKIGPVPDKNRPQTADKAWLGASTQVITSELAEALGVLGKKGVRVTGFLPKSPADAAGLKTGDLLFKLDGTVISASRPEDQELLSNLIRGYDVGSVVEFEGLREGQPLKVPVTLGKRPKGDVELPDYKDDTFEFSVRDLSMDQRHQAELSAEAKGVYVETVAPGGWTSLAGLRPGDILLAMDGKEVADVADLKARLKAFLETKPRRTVLHIKRGIRQQFLEVEPRW